MPYHRINHSLAVIPDKQCSTEGRVHKLAKHKQVVWTWWTIWTSSIENVCTVYMTGKHACIHVDSDAAAPKLLHSSYEHKVDCVIHMNFVDFRQQLHLKWPEQQVFSRPTLATRFQLPSIRSRDIDTLHLSTSIPPSSNPANITCATCIHHLQSWKAS